MLYTEEDLRGDLMTPLKTLKVASKEREISDLLHRHCGKDEEGS